MGPRRRPHPPAAHGRGAAERLERVDERAPRRLDAARPEPLGELRLDRRPVPAAGVDRRLAALGERHPRARPSSGSGLPPHVAAALEVHDRLRGRLLRHPEPLGERPDRPRAGHQVLEHHAVREAQIVHPVRRDPPLHLVRERPPREQRREREVRVGAAQRSPWPLIQPRLWISGNFHNHGCGNARSAGLRRRGLRRHRAPRGVVLARHRRPPRPPAQPARPSDLGDDERRPRRLAHLAPHAAAPRAPRRHAVRRRARTGTRRTTWRSPSAPPPGWRTP